MERMNIGELWEAIEDRGELFGKGFGCVFDFSSVELSSQLVCVRLRPLSHGVRLYISDSADLETASNLCGETALSSTEDNIKELSSIRHRRNIFPCSFHLGRIYEVSWW
jgi:hypothetical protein